MNWMIFAFFGAIFQAFESAIKKKALQVKGMNNVVAVIAFFVAGALFALAYFLQEKTLMPTHNLSHLFWNALIFGVVLNIVAVWFNYKALDVAQLSYLMPFMTLTSLSLIIPPMILLGEYPSRTSLLGILIIVFGAILMDWKKNISLSMEELKQRKNNRKGVLYFLATAACYTFTPTLSKITVVESGSVLFASYLTHLLIAIGFIPLIFLTPIGRNYGESMKNIKSNLCAKSAWKFFIAIFFAGVAIAIANGSTNHALQFASVSSVFAIKRTMPLFAFVLGVLYFKERNNLSQKIIATTIMIIGAVIITVLK